MHAESVIGYTASQREEVSPVKARMGYSKCDSSTEIQARFLT